MPKILQALYSVMLVEGKLQAKIPKKYKLINNTENKNKKQTAKQTKDKSLVYTKVWCSGDTKYMCTKGVDRCRIETKL